MTDTKPLKVFISYAWEDDLKTWVLDFATRLRSDGINAILDQWETVPGDQLTQFMERAVRESDFVVFVCTPTYKRKSDRRKGGVGYEGSIITGEVFLKNNHRKFIPVLRKGKWGTASPSWATSKLFIDFRGEPYSETSYQQLLNTLFGKSPTAPPVRDDTLRGKLEREAVESTEREKTEKAIREKTERDAIEKARLESEELERQRLAKEQADREASEKSARDKAEQDAIEKARLDAEELEKQKAAKTQADREAFEKTARDKAEQDAIEKSRLDTEELERQKAAKEKVERETVEKAAREKEKREINQNIAWEKIIHKSVEKDVPINAPANKEERQVNTQISKADRPELKKIKVPNKSCVSIIIIVVFVLCIFTGFAINKFAQNISAPPQPTNDLNIARTAAVHTVVAELTLKAAAFTPTLLPPTKTFIISPTPTLTSTPGKCNDYDFDPLTVDVNIPDGTVMPSGQEFLKTWRIRNTGSCSWGEGYKIIYVYGDKMSGQAQALTSVIEPGQEVEISVRFIAPTITGEYISAWQMGNSQGVLSFGKALYLKIIVK